MAMKVKGFKLTPLATAELVGVVVMGLMIIPFASSAYYNYSSGSAYNLAVDKFVGGDYVDATNALKKAIDANPQLYYPRELLGMTLYYQQEPGEAEAAYKALASTSDLSSGEERKPLARLAVQCLKLIQLTKGGNSIEDPSYVEAAEEIRKLAAKKNRYLEAKIVAAQLDLDRLTGEKVTANTKKQIIEGARSTLEKIEALANKKGKLSPWGAAVLYNSLGVTYFHQAATEYDRLQKLTLGKREENQKYGAVSELSAQACTYFRQALQYKLDWPGPFINFERAMAFKLVEKGLNDGTAKEYEKVPADKPEERAKWRVHWIYVALTYIKERDEHRGYLRYGRGIKLKKQWKDHPEDNDYALKNSLGWAYSMTGDHGNASSRLRNALKVNPTAGLANYNLARTRSAFWKQYEGLENINRKECVTSRQESYDFYKEALKNSGTMSDPLRRVRLNNNFGVFLFKGWKQEIPAALALEEAFKDYTGEVEGNAKLARIAAREKLGAALIGNLKAVYQSILDGSYKADVKEAYKDKLENLNRR